MSTARFLVALIAAIAFVGGAVGVGRNAAAGEWIAVAAAVVMFVAGAVALVWAVLPRRRR